MLALQLQQRGTAIFLPAGNDSHSTARRAIEQHTAYQVRLKIGPFFERRPLRGWNAYLRPGERFGLRDGIDAQELEDEFIAVPPDVFDAMLHAVEENPLQIREAPGAVAQRLSRNLALVSTSAQQMRNDDRFQKLFQDFEGEPAIQLHPGGGEQRTDGPCGSSLLANHFAQVGRGDPQLKYAGLLAIDFVDGHFLGLIDERLCDFFH